MDVGTDAQYFNGKLTEAEQKEFGDESESAEAVPEPAEPRTLRQARTERMKREKEERAERAATAAARHAAAERRKEQQAARKGLQRRTKRGQPILGNVVGDLLARMQGGSA